MLAVQIIAGRLMTLPIVRLLTLFEAVSSIYSYGNSDAAVFKHRRGVCSAQERR